MKHRCRRLRLDLRRDWQLYLFLLLPLAYIVLFCYVPMGGLAMAFENYSVRKGIFGSDWVGLENFIKFFRSYQCKRVIVNTLTLSAYTIIAGFPLPICFALMINSIPNKRAQKFSQSIVTLPHFISITVMVGILFQVFNSRTGLYGTWYEMIFNKYPSDLFASASNFRHMYVWSGVWQEFGWGSIIYTAALSSVAPSYHEAAEIDGATRFQRILHIDLPSILPTIVIMLILRMGSVMSIGFEKVYLMQNSLNMEASDIISTYVYQAGLAANGVSDFSYATANGFFNSIVNLVIITTVNTIAKKVGNTSLL